MNIKNLGKSSRLFAAGLCGTAVLAFAALDTQQAQAQDAPEEPRENDISQTSEASETAEPTDAAQKASSLIDLSEVRFQAEIVKTMGDTAMIMEANERELLLPQSVAFEPMADQNTQNDDPATSEEDSEAAVDPNSQPEYDESVALTNPKVGDTVEIRLDTTDAELVALENNVLTVRKGQTIMQLPADAVAQDIISQVSFSANMNGENQTLTLQDAIERDLDLTMAESYSSKLPDNADTGVLVASDPDRLLLVTVSDQTMKLIEIPQSMMAGEAVSLQQRDNGEVAVEPMESENKIAFEETMLKGQLISQTDDSIILEADNRHIILPANLELRTSDKNESTANVPQGTEITAVLPAGEAEMLNDGEGQAILETSQGVAQLPLEMLNRTQSEDVATVNVEQ